MDRIDIHVEVPALGYQELTSKQEEEKSEIIRERVKQARDIQLHRVAKDNIFYTAKITSRLMKKYCRIDVDSEKLLEIAINKLGLRARAYDRILISTIHGLNPSGGFLKTIQFYHHGEIGRFLVP